MFLILAIIALISAMLVVSLKNIMHCALFLGVFLLTVAGIFILLSADFLGIIQILLYVGGILILILFAIMLTARISSKLIKEANEQKGIAFFVCTILLAAILLVLRSTTFSVKNVFFTPVDGTVAEIGKLLFTTYVLPFEVASIVLLVALIGSIALGVRK
ncbi:MAG: NADH-quinone oxidoreductase subunit J [Candidatus Firestonebacteria bacterium]